MRAERPGQLFDPPVAQFDPPEGGLPQRALAHPVRAEDFQDYHLAADRSGRILTLAEVRAPALDHGPAQRLQGEVFAGEYLELRQVRAVSGLSLLRPLVSREIPADKLSARLA